MDNQPCTVLSTNGQPPASQPADDHPVFSGTIEDCICHFCKAYRSHEARRWLADAVGVSRTSITRWSIGGSVPNGLTAVKVAYALERCGYHVTGDFTKVPPTVKDLGKHLVYGLSSVGDTIDLFAVSSHSLHRWLLGKNEPSYDKMELIEMFVADGRDKLAAFERTLPAPPVPSPDISPDADTDHGVDGAAESDGELRGDAPTLKPDDAAAAAAAVLTSRPATRRETLLRLAFLVAAMRPLAAAVASDAFSADDRDELRRLTGRAEIFNLNNDFVKLCGERARRMT